MHFMFFPPISIKGITEKELNLTGVESLKSFRVTPEKISFTIEEAGEMQTIDIVKFNFPTPDVNYRREPDDDFPLELMPMATIEFLEAFAQQVKGYTLLTEAVPKTGYLELYRGDLYPISVRGSDKNLYATTAELRPLRKDYFVALNNFLQIDFEEQLETSLATFVENVLQPMSSTMNKVFEQSAEQGCESDVVNVMKDDFHSLILRTEELISIVNYNMDQTAERNKAFLRLSLPVMLKQAIFEAFSDYVELVTEHNAMKLIIKNRRIIDSEDLANVIIAFFH
jgi:hypothetical protein